MKHRHFRIGLVPFLCLASILFCLPGATAATAPFAGFNPAKLADMDAAITNAIAAGKLPGGVLWLERRGQVYHKAYGHRALSPNQEPITEDTIFDAASLTKVVACAPAIVLLIERGQLKLEDTLQTYLPEFTGGGKETITIHQLLTHTSGLRPDVDTRPPWKGYDTALRLACAEKLQTIPGTAFRYSDINFFLLGHVVQQVSGQKLEDFAAREIYGPLKMANTGFRPAPSKQPRIAPTERTDGVMLRGTVHDPTARYMGGVAGHAGLFTTAADLARYARMLLHGGELDGVRLFKPETVKLMTRVQSPDTVEARRGLGWDIDSGYSRPRGKLFPIGSYGHTGFTGTCLWIDPFSETFWIFLSNRVHPDGKGNVLPLQLTLGTLAAAAVDGFDFANVTGALPARFPLTATAAAATSPAPTDPPKFAPVLNGIDVLVKRNFAPLKKLRIGLITNHTGTDRHRNPTIDLLKAGRDVQLQALFSPEHGIRGEQDEKVGDSIDQKTGLPVYSLYPEPPKRQPGQSAGEYRTAVLNSRKPKPEQLERLDALVFDIQDIGCRFYTYISTLGLAMEAARDAGLKFFVLDRVNPINGTVVEGPLPADKPSFIAYHSIPVRHGMTVGELARMFNKELNLNLDLTVVPCEGWTRDMWFDETGLPWINTSPNMRNLSEAIFYPGIGLHETALAVGRGTDTPFEVIGAPYVDDLQLATELNGAGVAGVRFVPIHFTPAASTFKSRPCGGVYMMLTDRERFRAVDAGIAIALALQRLHPNDFALDKVNTLLQHPPAIEAIKAGKALKEIEESWAASLAEFKKRRQPFLIYK